MAQDVARPTLERLMDHFMPVHPSEIESAFDKIWQDASSGALDTSSVRLRVSNFLAWGLESEAPSRFENVMESLAQRHPCRGILAVMDASPSQLESAISAHCWRTASGSKHICSEEILLRGRTGTEQELASAVLALLVPDLPVHLWLIGEPDPLRRIPEEILEVADRVYVDSSAAALLPMALSSIHRAASHDDVTIVDLAWQRSLPWRDLAAQLFDGRAAPLLDKITSIEIVGGHGILSGAVILLAGWLVSRLDLNAASLESSNLLVTATFYDGSRALALRLLPSDAGLELDRIRFQAEGAVLEVQLHAESGHMHVRSDWVEEPVHRTVTAQATDDASLLTAAIEDQSSPAIYLSALRVAVDLAG